jgi:hypothetical protein
MGRRAAARRGSRPNEIGLLRLQPMPSRPKFTGLANTIAPSAASVSLNRIPLTPATGRTTASRRASIGLVDPPPAGPGWLHALALLVGQEAVMLRGGSRSICRRGADRWEAGCETTGEATSARARGRGGQRTAGRDAAGGARRAHQGTAAQLSVSVFMQDKCWRGL